MKRSSEQIIRSEDRIIQSLQQINDTLLEGFKRLPVKVDVSRTVVMQQSQRAAQSQQLGVRMLNAAPVVEEPEKAEEAKKR
ncbi:hypothetical protein ACFTAO_41885 [Paenibacillus rhizoplanae]